MFTVIAESASTDYMFVCTSTQVTCKAANKQDTELTDLQHINSKLANVTVTTENAVATIAQALGEQLTHVATYK